LSVRVQLPSYSFLRNLSAQRLALIAFGVLATFFLILVLVAGLFYHKYAKLTDEKLLAGPFPNSSMLFAAPAIVGVGDSGTPAEIASQLRQSGYGEDAQKNKLGWFHLRPDAIEIFPGPDSYFESEPGVIRFGGAKVSSIISLHDNAPRTQYELEPQLLSSLFDKNREKRRLVKFADIPPILVNAVVSIEDKRFFQHSGFDPIRIVKAMFVDIRERRNAQGASTITQQLARSIWLDPRKTFGRKFAELAITLHLEQKLTKQQIFEYYANQVDLGRRGSFAIRGFGEASQAYFGKDIRELNLAEAATLAGLIQQPSARNPVRWPERAKTRRNTVLAMMRDNGYITPSQMEVASAAPMVTARQGIESADAPYFVDLVNEQLADQFSDHDLQDTGYRVFTTIDMELQHDAAEAVAIGMKELDAVIARQNKGKDAVPVDPQVALIVADPHTGEIRALIGGRNYGVSQLNHALAKRPSGSVFKPFVYAAAINTGLSGDKTAVVTTSTILQDEPTTFMFAGQPYEPGNYHGAWHGDVSVREALAGSLNVPTVALAEKIGYRSVSDLAHKAGLNSEIHPTPAMALGSYDVTPLEMVGAYTMFANGGTWVKPRLIDRIRDKAGDDIWEGTAEEKRVLDPRVDWIMVNMMQDVLRYGTGAGVRSRGFGLPAAGKTGTSHDAWFAGFTSKLLCVVWVGLDDYRDLKIEGAKAALPIWTEFMKRAHQHRAYRNVTDFQAPSGVASASIDPLSGELGTTSCPKVINEYYIDGTQPTVFCRFHANGSTQIAGWDTSDGSAPSGAAAKPADGQTLPDVANGQTAPNGQVPPPNADAKKKKGILDKLKNIFK
jgi:penicillin-binding protein 1B